MPSIGTIIGKIKCRVTGKVFPLYKYMELKSGLKLYQVAPENSEGNANYIVWGQHISLSHISDMSSMARTIVLSFDVRVITLPPNFMLLGD